jgi:hypothetical protein
VVVEKFMAAGCVGWVFVDGDGGCKGGKASNIRVPELFLHIGLAGHVERDCSSNLSSR